ncbi:MAG: hypothetical protein LBK82_08840 [Planctomycetaceae bacterium]|nr:hypothetical protein [Planctomycetaceae bacterium]
MTPKRKAIWFAVVNLVHSRRPDSAALNVKTEPHNNFSDSTGLGVQAF